MNAQEYVKYEKRVADFIEREEINFLSTSCAEECGQTEEDGANVDPWFSGHACDCCGDTDGGNREYLYARFRPDDSIVRFEICENCVYYVNYGQLDDTTMAEMESIK